MRSSPPYGALPPDSAPPRPDPWRRPGHAPGHALLRVLLFALILAAVAVMALLRHGGAILLPNLLALGLMGLVYAFVRLEPPRPAGLRRPLAS